MSCSLQYLTSVSVPTWWKKWILQLLQEKEEVGGGGWARGRPTAAPALGLLAFSLCVSGASGIYCVSSNKWLPASKQFKLINLRWMSQVLQITEDWSWGDEQWQPGLITDVSESLCMWVLSGTTVYWVFFLSICCFPEKNQVPCHFFLICEGKCLP